VRLIEVLIPGNIVLENFLVNIILDCEENPDTIYFLRENAI